MNTRLSILENEVTYRKQELLRFALHFNPDYPLGAGLVANVKGHQTAIHDLEVEIEQVKLK